MGSFGAVSVNDANGSLFHSLAPRNKCIFKSKKSGMGYRHILCTTEQQNFYIIPTYISYRVTIHFSRVRDREVFFLPLFGFLMIKNGICPPPSQREAETKSVDDTDSHCHSDEVQSSFLDEDLRDELCKHETGDVSL